MAVKKAAAKGKKAKALKKPVPSKVKKAPSKAVKAPAANVAKAKAAPSKGRPSSTSAGSKPLAGPAGNAKPAKLTSGLKKADLEHFRELLLEKRREILGDVGSMENEAFKSGSNLSNMPIHMADVGTDNFEQEFTLGLIESERQILREIQEALGRVEDGSFGLCVATGKPIGRMRLEAVPWAKYTIEYSRALEQGLVRRDADQPHEEEASSGGGGGEEDEE